MKTPNVVIVMAKCSQHQHQSFGIRFEEMSPRQWVADWAFAIKETAAKREGYDRTQITGTFKLTNTYPNCPYCESSNIIRCGKCGKVSCWQEGDFTCGWCGNRGKVSGHIQSLSAGEDR
jgi:hypothetical protein